MKSFDEICENKNINVILRTEEGMSASACLLSTRARHGKWKDRCMVIASNGMGWDHVSVSFPMRCPTWAEMCEIKSIFFRDDEVCVEYHPAADEYVNTHPYCLHIFRPQDQALPTPPSWMVGLKRGQTIDQLRDEIDAAYEGSGHK